MTSSIVYPICKFRWRRRSCAEVRQTSQQGFTLIEVLVALTILSLSLAIIFAGFSSGLRAKRMAVDYQQATVLAESKLNSIGIETPVVEGQTVGRFDDRFRWQVVVARYQEDGRDELGQGKIQPLEVTVTVFWGTSSDGRSVSLKTLKLLPL